MRTPYIKFGFLQEALGACHLRKQREKKYRVVSRTSITPRFSKNRSDLSIRATHKRDELRPTKLITQGVTS